MSTFLDKIEEGFADFRAELEKVFGDHPQVHSLSSDLKAHVLGAAADHFGDPADKQPESAQPTGSESAPPAV